MSELKLGIQMGYWGAGPNPNMISLAQEAERLGYDAIFTAEAWGSDVFMPLAWIGAHTERIRLGTPWRNCQPGHRRRPRWLP